MAIVKGKGDVPLDHSMIVDGKKIADDVIALLGDIDRSKRREKLFYQKDVVRALLDNDVKALRKFSQIYFERSGIYSRLCRYMASLYRYDWMLTPVIYDDKVSADKVIEGWYKASNYLENCHLKKMFSDISLKVVRDGCYYGYMVQTKQSTQLQELPVDYCRSRYSVNGNAVVEFNVKYFDDAFPDPEYRMRILKMFPIDVRKGYVAYRRGTLPKDFLGDDSGWVPLDPAMTVRFDMFGSEEPLFVSVVPAIMDLEDAQDLEKKRMQQQLQKIIVQKMPIDKNGNLLFDLSEVRALHNNAVTMLSGAIGTSVLSTFADVTVADLSDKGNLSSVDQLNKMERTVYNEAGVSQLQFNSEGNIALGYSIQNDESTMQNLVLQYEAFMEKIISPFNKSPKRLVYRVIMLPTTVYNYKELSALYKEQTMLGFSKLLPQVALGMSQCEVISTAVFENDMLSLDDVFVPPQMSSTMSGNDDKGGRPEKADEDKSEKTMKNIEVE